VAGGSPISPLLQQAPREEQTRPRVQPSRGRRQTIFAVLFTLREEPGHHGALAVAYRIAVSGPPHRSSSCAPPQPPAIEEGAAATVTRVRLPSPAPGWCAGRYRVTVYLERGPYCPPPAQGQPPPPCPLFATQELDTGEAGFVVRSSRPRS
jgi:hypothetical protein